MSEIYHGEYHVTSNIGVRACKHIEKEIVDEVNYLDIIKRSNSG